SASPPQPLYTETTESVMPEPPQVVSLATLLVATNLNQVSFVVGAPRNAPLGCRPSSVSPTFDRVIASPQWISSASEQLSPPVGGGVQPLLQARLPVYWAVPHATVPANWG